MIAKLLALHFTEEVRRSGRFVVGIDGPGCCGKSSLVDGLSALVGNCAHLATDDFHLPRGSPPEAGSPLPYRRWTQFMLAARRLAEGRSARVRPIDWRTRALAPEVVIEPAPLLFIEGIAALHPEVTPMVNYRIWVDGRAETRLERVRRRDGEAEVPNWQKYIAFEQRYLEVHRPWTSADLWVFGAELGMDASPSFSRLIDTRGRALAETPG